MKSIVIMLILSGSTVYLSAQKIEAISTSNVTAIYGESKDGRGVYGRSTNGRGVFGKSDSGDGVYGKSTNSYGINGESTNSFGVFGYSVNQNGVTGNSESASGVSGYTQLGDGVSGRSDNGKGIVAWGKTYNFDAVGPGIDYGSTSSIRWKRNIKNIPDPIERLSKLRGIYFDWDENHGGHHDIGFIAEEIGAVIPEIVGYEENGIDATGMDYSKMTPLLVEAANAMRREYQEKFEDQQSEIETLKERLSKMEGLMEKIAVLEQILLTKTDFSKIRSTK